MADNYGARKDGTWKIIFLQPDVCKTPMGSAIVPIPYPGISDLGQAFGVVESVRLNGNPAVVYDQSKSPETRADGQGKAMGIKSNTVGMKCEPLDKSSSVRAEKKWVVRHDDKFWMNGA
jgi:hypothetical protein